MTYKFQLIIYFQLNINLFGGLLVLPYDVFVTFGPFALDFLFYFDVLEVSDVLLLLSISDTVEGIKNEEFVSDKLDFLDYHNSLAQIV